MSLGGEARAGRWATKAHNMYRAGETIAGRYGVLRVIASGGMAEVYEVVDKTNGELRALKTPIGRYAGDTKIVERMVREAKALAKLDDENLVKVYDAGADEGQFFMVMALLDGPSLKHLSEGRKLPLGAALSLTRQLATGLSVLHALGHVHRDIKPDNFIVLERPKAAEHTGKLIDLGVAKFADASTTSEGITFGTVSYMAPEQILGERVDARADVYALGLVMYELLAGVHPLIRKGRPASRDEWVERQLVVVPDPLADVVPSVPPAVSNLVMRACAKRRDQRFADALELAKQICALELTLKQTGQLGAVRVEPFDRSAAKAESGPQPVARVRPPNVETPHAGLPEMRTEEAVVPQPPAEPLPLKAEPPRVAPHEGDVTRRGTQRMLGPKGTKPNLDVPWSPSPSEVAPKPVPGGQGAAVERSPAKETPSNDREHSSSDAAPALAPKPAPSATPAVSPWRDVPGPKRPPIPITESSRGSAVPSSLRATQDPSRVQLWLQAMALGLLLAIVGIGVVATVALRRNDGEPTPIQLPTAPPSAAVSAEVNRAEASAAPPSLGTLASSAGPLAGATAGAASSVPRAQPPAPSLAGRPVTGATSAQLAAPTGSPSATPQGNAPAAPTASGPPGDQLFFKPPPGQQNP